MIRIIKKLVPKNPYKIIKLHVRNKSWGYSDLNVAIRTKRKRGKLFK